MLTIVVGEEELFDNDKNEFLTQGGVVVELEHSLISLSKWESKFQKPFLTDKPKSEEEIFWYIRCMIKSPVENSEIMSMIEQRHLDMIVAYIDSKQSATTFGMMPEQRSRGETITSELIYYWMTAFSIPWEAENWHLNRLFSLIRICNVKNSKPKKMSKSELAARNRELNAARRRELNTTG